MTTPVWPSFFLVGAPKAGTTAISSALTKHPDVFPCAVKEPNFFNPDIWLENFWGPINLDRAAERQKHSLATIRDEATYLRLYEGAVGYRAVGDCSVHYLRSRLAAEAIHKKVPDAKIVIALRNPIDRAYSHFLMDCKVGKVGPPFSNIVRAHLADLGAINPHYDNYIECGLYFEQVHKYIEVFGRNNVLVVLFEEIEQNFQNTMMRILDHIGIELRILEPVFENRAVVAKASLLNRWLYTAGLRRLIVRYCPKYVKSLGIKYYYRLPEHTRIEPQDRAFLIDVFKEDVEKLAKLIERDLSHWVTPVTVTQAIPEKISA